MKSVEFLSAPKELPSLSFFFCLAPKADKVLFGQYCGWLALLAKRGLGIKPIHEKTFNYLYRAVSRNWGKKNLLGALQKEFIARNLSLSLLLEPVDGFGWMSKKRYALPFDKATPILLQIIAPLTRLIAVLNNQRPPFYQPCSHLFFAYLLIYVRQMPELRGLLAEACIMTNDENLARQLPPLFDEAKQSVSVTSGMRFKFKIAFMLGLCRRLIAKTKQKNAEKLNFFDYVNAFLYGLWYWFSIRDNSRGLNKL